MPRSTSKKIGIMQPYLFPYLGYFQLISAVDVFVLCDDLQYIHQGWINRNKILVNGKPQYLLFPLKKGSHLLKINERFFFDGFAQEVTKLLRKIAVSYAKAPFFKDVFPLLENIMTYQENNLAKYIENSIRAICSYLGIATPILLSSTMDIDSSLRAQNRVIEIVKRLDGDVYINPIGGVNLYRFDDFRRSGITLKFHRMNDVRYRQFGNEFEPSLSIIDVLMFNSTSEVRKQLSNYSLEDANTSRAAA